MKTVRILCADLAGLRAQALGLVEAAGLAPDLRMLSVQTPWSYVSPAFWWNPLRAVAAAAIAGPLPELVIGCGGAGARVAAALRRPGVQAVAIQHPRMPLEKFDMVFAARHDGIAGPNVFVTRTALHQATPARLAEQAAIWRPVFAPLRRPLVAVLLGGSNGRYWFEAEQAQALAAQLADLAKRDGVGLVITPSRRTPPSVMAALRRVLAPLGAWIWDGEGENPYFGMLGLADAILATADSVSMVSEAAATAAPLYLLRLPGKSTRIGAFMDQLLADGRARNFAGTLDLWDAAPLDDTAQAGAALRARLRI